MRCHRIQWRHRENFPADRGVRRRVFYKWGNRSESRATCLCKARGNSVCTVEASSLLLLLRRPISKRGTQNLPTLLLFLLPPLLSCTWSSKASVFVASPSSSLSPKPLQLFFPNGWDWTQKAAAARGCVWGERGCIWRALWRRFRPRQDRSTTWACCCSWWKRKRVEEGMRLWKGLEHHPCYWGYWEREREEEVGECYFVGNESTNSLYHTLIYPIGF